MQTILNINDFAFIAYLLGVVMSVYIVSLLILRWVHYGICTEKKYVMLLTTGYGIRSLALAYVRYLFLDNSEAHIPALNSTWWSMSQLIPVVLTAIVLMHISYYLFDERSKKNELEAKAK